jgi:hypothetical protein
LHNEQRGNSEGTASRFAIPSFAESSAAQDFRHNQISIADNSPANS